MKNIILTAALAWASASAASAAVIDTRPGNDLLGFFGEPDSSTFGQTLTAPANATTLNTFKFSVVQDTPDAVDFRFFVMAWDGTKATGSILFQSAVQQTTTQGSAEIFSFSPNVPVTAGQGYVAFINNSGLQATAPDNGALKIAARTDTDAYTGGAFVFQNNGTDFLALTDTDWIETSTVAYDIAFAADFTVVPETGTLLPLFALSSAMGLALARKRRK